MQDDLDQILAEAAAKEASDLIFKWCWRSLFLTCENRATGYHTISWEHGGQTLTKRRPACDLHKDGGPNHDDLFFVPTRGRGG